ncbi:MAG: glucuronate isomerase [Ruminococcaceae bacterium]|nr:glucuronate isomerase [Oscillospiraceae bacterium]
MAFIHDDFMLHSDVSKRLYHEYAEALPIIDYHCHLNPEEIATDRQYQNITELTLEGDHYKWRLMRAAGVEEDYITGGADPQEKFKKWAEVVPLLIGNPLYHWTHLELKRYFGIDALLSGETADEIYRHCNQVISQKKYSARSLITQSGAEVVCTTDDPSDALTAHQTLSCGFSVKVLPTFRPDKAILIDRDTFLPYMESIGVSSYTELKKYMLKRLDYFHEHGCRLADHGMDGGIPFARGDAEAVFKRAFSGEAISTQEADLYKTEMNLFFASEYARRGWTLQLHIGALRNTNSAMEKSVGKDAGFDSIDDVSVARPLARFLDTLEADNMLPKTILYNLHPKDNYTLASMAGNFQKSPWKTKVQFGSAWWFNDQRDGMEAQMRTLANFGILPYFVGMLTDSRSFLSFVRHEYFRRILCNLLGTWVTNGEYPSDYDRLGQMVKNICYLNAKQYFGF